MSFAEAAVALWVREEVSTKEKVSLLSFLHSLDYFDINVYLI